MPQVGLPHYLSIAAVLFALGVYAVLTRRNILAVLIGIELILNAANINLVAFARYNVAGLSRALAGQVGTVLTIILACCQIGIALAIVLNLVRRAGTADADQADMLRD